VAVIGLVFFAGTLAGGVLSGSQPRTGPSGSGPGPEGQAFVIAGTETILVRGPNGNIVSSWTGPDPMQPAGINAIASCVSGGSVTPFGFGGCANLIQVVQIDYGPTTSGGYLYSADATNSLTPAGCNPTSSNDETQLCTGWTTSATFGPSTFTEYCSTQCYLAAVQTYGPPGTPSVFSEICGSSYYGGSSTITQTFSSTTYVNLPCQTSPPVSSFATISAGESLSINIQFSIS